LLQTPTLGHAIQLRGSPTNTTTKGRIFQVGIFKRSAESIFYGESYTFWSDDLGKTWVIGGINAGRRENGASRRGLGESCAVELENGDVLINSRNYQDGKPVGLRAVTLAHFDQQGNIHFEPTYHDPALVEPTVEGSLIRYTYSSQSEYGGKSRILFCNPNHPKGRYNLTVRLSYDEGRTWPISKVIDPGPSAYSDLVIQNDMKIGVLYERGNHGGLYYLNFTLDWLTDGEDRLTMDNEERVF
jgi:sialidase-1